MTTLMIPTTTGLLGARNPVVKVVAATVPAVLLIASRDAVTPALVLGLTVLALPAVGMSARALLRRTRPLVLAAISVGAVNAVFGVDGVSSGMALGLRALGLALPGVLVLSSTDPVDLADSLVQQLHAPPKFAYGTLAALRLLPLLGQEWQVIGMARRARGVDAGRNPLVAVQLFTSQVLGLLVLAIRRGTRLATAMDARGFDSQAPRSRARVQAVTRADLLLLLVVTAGSVAALVASISLGTWKPLVG
jgi:energy-coupling factor transport system permease protein